MKINTCEKLACNLYENKKTCHTHKILIAGTRIWTKTRKTKQEQRIQSASLVEALYTHEHRTKNKGQNESVNEFFKLINSFVFKKIMGNARNHRDIQLVTTDKQRNHLA